MKHSSATRRAGFAAAFALVIVLAITALTTIGLRARAQDLALERHQLTRVCARWAAESALSLARAQLARTGGLAQGQRGMLEDELTHMRIDYVLSREGSTSGRTWVLAEGICTLNRSPPIRAAIRAELSRGFHGPEIREWIESPDTAH